MNTAGPTRSLDHMQPQSSQSSNRSTPFLFFHLPAELRGLVYDHLLATTLDPEEDGTSYSVLINRRGTMLYDNPKQLQRIRVRASICTVLQASSQLRGEYLDVVRKKASFHYEGTLSSVSQMHLSDVKLGTIGTLYDPTLLRSFSVDIRRSNGGFSPEPKGMMQKVADFLVMFKSLQQLSVYLTENQADHTHTIIPEYIYEYQIRQQTISFWKKLEPLRELGGSLKKCVLFVHTCAVCMSPDSFYDWFKNAEQSGLTPARNCPWPFCIELC